MGDCCDSPSQSSNKISPDGDYVQTISYGRLNGWSCPLHPLQVIGWFFIILFAITHFAILVHYLPVEWLATGIIIPACGYVIHLVYHLLALTLDPADPAVRRKGTFLKKMFDRKEHSHVIENSFCYICQTEVSSRSKHCSKCNKCISEFDHHCIWLNNCVGGRNYKLFLGSCISAFLTALVMFIIDCYLMIVYYTARSDVLGRSEMVDWMLFVSVCKEAYVIFVIVNGLLLFIAMLLLGHLIIFHGYLCCKKMTTYDYVLRQRSYKDGLENSDVESVGEAVPPLIGQISSSHSIGNHVDVEKRRSIELQKMKQHDVYVDMDAAEASGAKREETIFVGIAVETQSPLAVESNIVSTEAAHVYEAVDDVTPSFSVKKKKRSSKNLTSSKVQLIKDEGDSSSLSSAHSKLSIISVSHGDEEDDNIHHRTSDSALDHFVVQRDGSKSAPVQLDENTAYANTVQQVDRSESAVDRPRSPSPKQSQRISFVNQQNDYVMRVMDKRASNSSLSTLALQDHDEFGMPLSPARVSRTSKPNLSPTREESFDSGKPSSSSKPSSSKSSVRKIEVKSNEEPVLLEEQNFNASLVSLNNPALVGVNTQEKTQRLSALSHISLSAPKKESFSKAPRISTTSTLTNITLTSEKFPTMPSETELIQPVPDGYNNAGDLVLTNALSENSTLIFEDEFVKANDGNVNFLQQSLIADEKRLDATSIKAIEPKKAFNDTVVPSDTDSHKLASYVDAFKRKKRDSDQYSFGSESAASGSGVPIAVLNEETDTYALKDSLQRVKKLSDAFPTASSEQDKQSEEKLPRPRFQKHESMAELSVVEFNRKKKLKKKRSSGGASKHKQLPPLRGLSLNLMPEVQEEKGKIESDV